MTSFSFPTGSPPHHQICSLILVLILLSLLGVFDVISTFAFFPLCLVPPPLSSPLDPPLPVLPNTPFSSPCIWVPRLSIPYHSLPHVPFDGVCPFPPMLCTWPHVPDRFFVIWYTYLLCRMHLNYCLNFYNLYFSIYMIVKSWISLSWLLFKTQYQNNFLLTSLHFLYSQVALWLNTLIYPRAEKHFL